MHIGGMRTAFFVWLWARHTGGTFILRIDDTDQERNVEAALEPIFRAFRWLGLDWDEGPDKGGPHAPYYQSQRTHHYQAAVKKLMDAGLAFKDFDAPEQVQEDRAKAEAAKQNYVNVRRSLELTPEQVAQFEADGRPYVVRFLVPRDKTVAIDDAVRGHVEWSCATMPDPVIMRSNGTFLYNFASVVDDAEMEITHIIRAEEHLANTAVQATLFDALGAPRPVFAHIPFITAPGSTKKLSKRDIDKLKNVPALRKMFERGDVVLPQLNLGNSTTLSPVMVGYYEKMGYLPEAILNTLARFGWSLDDKTEILPLDLIIQNFTLDRVVKSAAGFDADKLQANEAWWMEQLPLDRKLAGVRPYIEQLGWIADDEKLTAILKVLGERLKIFSDILDYPEFFVSTDSLTYDEKTLGKFRQQAEGPQILSLLESLFTNAPEFKAAPLHDAVVAAAEQQGLKLGQVVSPLRLALTGKSSGADLFQAAELLGKDVCLERLKVLTSKLS